MELFLKATHTCIGSKQKPQGQCPGAFLLDQMLIDYAAIAFFFLRQPSRPNPTRPVVRWGAALESAPHTAVAAPLGSSHWDARHQDHRNSIR